MSALQDSPRITPFLWFDKNAEEAVDFYLSVFKNSRRLGGLHSPDDSAAPKGSVLTVAFELDGQKFTALNGGPMFKFTEAVSFVVRCEDQAEIDYYWSKLTADGGQREPVWLAQRQVWSFLADYAGAHRRTDQDPQGHAGHDGHEETQHRRTGTRQPIVNERSRQFPRHGEVLLCRGSPCHVQEMRALAQRTTADVSCYSASE